MARRPYRVEVYYPKKNPPRYYLVRDVRSSGLRTKVKQYLCSDVRPTQEDLEKYRKIHAYALELKAAKAAGKLGTTKFKTTYLSKGYVDTIEEIRYLYKRFTETLTVNELEQYEKYFEIHYIHGTTAIEGNTLTLGETEDLLLYGIIPESKNIREVYEVQNFKNVKKYRDEYKGKINLDFIRHLHAIIMQNIDDQNAGIFRNRDDIGISGCDLRICSALMIKHELESIIRVYYDRISKGYHPFEEAIMFHYFFEMIHPFTNGNGRVGREILNFMLSKGKYPKLLFLGEARDRYIHSLKLGNNELYPEMNEYFASIIIDQRLDILRSRIKSAIEKPPQREGQLTLSTFIKLG